VFRRAIAIVAVGLATGFGLAVTAESAAADTVTQSFECYPGGGTRTMKVTLTAPATVTKGQPAPVHIELVDTRPWTGSAIPAGQSRITAWVKLGGVGSGEVQAYPLTNPADIPTGGTYRIERTHQFTFTTAGTVTLAVRAFGVPLYAGCGTPAGATPPVAETVTVRP
jgi:hypothetical protein